MASKVPTTQPQIPASYQTPMAPTQGVYMMPVQQPSNRNVRPVPGIKCLSITITILASLLTVLGVVAVTIKARHSYVGNPIWTGLLFLLTTGILGIFVYKKKNNFCMNIAFLVMSIITSVFLYQCFIYAMEATSNEYWRCNPGADYNYYYTYDSYCTPRWSRLVVGVAIVFVALAALVLCIISCSLTMYGTFQCCYRCCNCCRNSNSPSMVQYSPYTGVLMTPVNGQPMQVMASTPQMIPQGHPGTQQPIPGSQPLLVASPQPFTPNAPPAYMATPNAGSPPQTTMVPGNQPFTSGAATVSSGDQLPTSGNVQVVEEKPDISSAGQIADNPQNWQQF